MADVTDAQQRDIAVRTVMVTAHFRAAGLSGEQQRKLLFIRDTRWVPTQLLGVALEALRQDTPGDAWPSAGAAIAKARELSPGEHHPGHGMLDAPWYREMLRARRADAAKALNGGAGIVSVLEHASAIERLTEGDDGGELQRGIERPDHTE